MRWGLFIAVWVATACELGSRPSGTVPDGGSSPDSGPAAAPDAGHGVTDAGPPGPDLTRCFDDAGQATSSVDLAPCNIQADCQCPLACVADEPRRQFLLAREGTNFPAFCERPCSTSGDCPLPSELCVAGHCVEVPCDAHGQACDAGAVLNGTCTANAVASVVGPAYNTSFQALSANAFAFPYACWLAGTSTSTCDIAAPPSSPAQRCRAGYPCAPADLLGTDTQGACLKGCSPQGGAAGAAPCGAERCVTVPVSGRQFEDVGFCAAGGAGTCLQGIPPAETEFYACTADAQCACPETCQDAGFYAPNLCERSCTTQADCPNPATLCKGGFCLPIACSADPLTPCDFLDAGDGTCVTESRALLALAGGWFCARAGSLGQGAPCDVRTPQGLPLAADGGFQGAQSSTFLAVGQGQLCAVGQLCVGNAVGSTQGICRPTCDVNADGGACGAGNACLFAGQGAGRGVCGPCWPASRACLLDTDCCSGACDAGRCG